MLELLAQTPEQIDLQEMVGRFLERHAGPSHARRQAETGAPDLALFTRLHEEVGVTALLADDPSAWKEAVIVHEELGRGLAGVPALGSSLALIAVLEADPTDEIVATAAQSAPLLAFAFDPAARDGEAVTADADVLSGRTGLVIDGMAAEVLVVPAETAAGLRLYAVDAAAPGVRREAVATLDPTRFVACVELSGVVGRPIGPDTAFDLVAAVVKGQLMIASELVGVARRALDLASDHARTRQQFGRPIGGFQVVKHLLAGAYVRVESIRSLVRWAATALAVGDPRAILVAAMAVERAAEAAYRVSADGIQVHGGIGYTWEVDAQLLFKRATTSTQLLGGHRALRRRVADLMGV
jgi:alkylation response protein AidB-like acyl-CoA dehydrogenase